MGDYTEQLKFYKPDPDEFVDVEVQLNRNWDIADKAVKRLLEYEYTTAQVPDIVDSWNRPKFFKAYSNSVMTYFRSGNFFWQGPSTPVNSFTSARTWLSPGWSEHSESPLFVRSNQRTSGATKMEIEWVGAIWMGGSIIPANTNTVVMPDGAIPTTFRPVRNQYFTLYGGNTAANYSIFRLFIGDTGRMEVKRYGTDDFTSTDERRLELTGIKYDLNVTA